MENWQICLICGAIGLLIVVLFSLSTGIGNGNLTPTLKFDNAGCSKNTVELPARNPRNSADKSSYKVSNLKPVGSCPVGYTFFTDLEGNALCCATAKINMYERSCSARGKEGVCSFVPGIVDTREDKYSSKTYPLCSAIAEEHQLKAAGSYCPVTYKYHVTTGGGYTIASAIDLAGGQSNYQKLWTEIVNKNPTGTLDSANVSLCAKLKGTVANGGGGGTPLTCRVNKPSYKCCTAYTNPGSTDCNSGSKFCEALVQGQNVFNAPGSCENLVLLESLECPDNTSLIPDFKMTKVPGSVVPICIGAKANCLPRKVLEEGRKNGLFNDINIDTNIINCEVHDKYYNVRSLSNTQVELKVSKDL